MNFNETVGSIVYDFSKNKPKGRIPDNQYKILKDAGRTDLVKKVRQLGGNATEQQIKDLIAANPKGGNKGGGGGTKSSTPPKTPDPVGKGSKPNLYQDSEKLKVRGGASASQTVRDLQSKYNWHSKIAGSKIGDIVKYQDPESGKTFDLRVTQKSIDDSSAWMNTEGLKFESARTVSGGSSARDAIDAAKLEADLKEIKGHSTLRQAEYEQKVADWARYGAQQDAYSGEKISESKANAAEHNLRAGIAEREEENQNYKQGEKRKLREEGVVGYGMGKAIKNIKGYTDNVGNIIGGATDAWLGTVNAVKAADLRLFDVDKNKIKGYVKHSKKAEELRSLADKASEGDYKNSLIEKAERAEEKANEKYETARAQKRADSFKTAGNVFGSIKDTLSSKSRARTLAERGQAGVKRREAQIAYAMGDHSFFTKLAAGKSFGSKNAFTRAIGKIPGWMVYGRKENKARKNYATQLSYGGFSVGADMAQTMIHDFSDFDDLMEQTTGEGWQYREYPELAKILDDDKYEKLDQKVMESGEFSEGEGETPPDGIIDSDSLRPGREEVTINDILSKNYYTASPVEKKFQEMIARGFSESNSTPYENFLQSFSDNADTMRMM